MRRQAGRPAIALLPHQHGLGLVRGVVAEQQMQDAVPRAGSAEGRVARSAGAFGQRRAGAEVSQAQHRGRDAACGEALNGQGSFGRGFRPQSVVDHQSAQ